MTAPDEISVTVDAAPMPGLLRPAIEAALAGRAFPDGPERAVARAVAGAVAAAQSAAAQSAAAQSAAVRPTPSRGGGAPC
jgi:hypothetical protein